MSTFTFLPFTESDHPCYDELIEEPWFRAWNHWINPLGNWHEPLPFPEKRVHEANRSRIPNWIWWALRNPGHNFSHFWAGITPIGSRYEWILPMERGWSSSKYFWKNGWKCLPKYNGWFGWQRRGNFRLGVNSDG